MKVHVNYSLLINIGGLSEMVEDFDVNKIDG